MPNISKERQDALVERTENPIVIPEIPKYVETPSNRVYSKTKRIYSQNLQRAMNANVHNEVYNITGKNSGYNTQDMCTVFNYVNLNWNYYSDATDSEGADFFLNANQTIRDGYKGDCDDYAIVISALMKDMGFNTRVTLALNTNSGHAYPEIYIGDDLETVNSIISYISSLYPQASEICYSKRSLSDGTTQYWLNLDWSASYPGGAFFYGAKTMYYPNGA